MYSTFALNGSNNYWKIIMFAISFLFVQIKRNFVHRLSSYPRNVLERIFPLKCAAHFQEKRIFVKCNGKSV